MSNVQAARNDSRYDDFADDYEEEENHTVMTKMLDATTNTCIECLRPSTANVGKGSDEEESLETDDGRSSLDSQSRVTFDETLGGTTLSSYISQQNKQQEKSVGSVEDVTPSESEESKEGIVSIPADSEKPSRTGWFGFGKKRSSEKKKEVTTSEEESEESEAEDANPAEDGPKETEPESMEDFDSVEDDLESMENANALKKIGSFAIADDAKATESSEAAVTRTEGTDNAKEAVEDDVPLVRRGWFGLPVETPEPTKDVEGASPEEVKVEATDETVKEADAAPADEVPTQSKGADNVEEDVQLVRRGWFGLKKPESTKDIEQAFSEELDLELEAEAAAFAASTIPPPSEQESMAKTSPTSESDCDSLLPTEKRGWFGKNKKKEETDALYSKGVDLEQQGSTNTDEVTPVVKNDVPSPEVNTSTSFANMMAALFPTEVAAEATKDAESGVVSLPKGDSSVKIVGVDKGRTDDDKETTLDGLVDLVDMENKERGDIDDNKDTVSMLSDENPVQNDRSIFQDETENTSKPPQRSWKRALCALLCFILVVGCILTFGLLFGNSRDDEVTSNADKSVGGGQSPETGTPTDAPTAVDTPTNEVLFSAISSVPYDDRQASDLEELLVNLDGTLDFIVHVGNLRGADSTDCAQSDYETAASVLAQSPVPVFVLPGNNDWSVCDNPREGRSFWESTFIGFEDRWDNDFRVGRQPDRDHNFVFEYNEVLFLGFYIPAALDEPEEVRESRLIETYAFGRAVVKRYVESLDGQTGRVVMFGFAEPDDSHATFFDRFTTYLTEELEDSVPVLYVNGEGQEYSYSENFYGNQSFLRVTVPAGVSEDPTIFRVVANGSPQTAADAFIVDRS